MLPPPLPPLEEKTNYRGARSSRLKENPELLSSCCTPTTDNPRAGFLGWEGEGGSSQQRIRALSPTGEEFTRRHYNELCC